MTVKLLTEDNLEFLSLKGGCTGLSKSTLVKMPHCWKSHVGAHMPSALLFEIYKFKQAKVNISHKMCKQMAIAVADPEGVA